jgi:hypothetical protein
MEGIIQMLEERGWHRTGTHKVGSLTVTRSPPATDAQLREAEERFGFQLPDALKSFYGTVGGLRVEGRFTLCNLEEAWSTTSDFESDREGYVESWINPHVPQRCLVLHHYGAGDHGDGVIYDADLADFVEVFHKEGVSRRGLNPLAVVLDAITRTA